MRIDPSSIFLHTIASVPLRVLLGWLAGTLGAFTPVFLQAGIEAWGIIHWQFLFFPFYLFLIAFFSGWWGLVAVPLLIAFGWKLLSFMREDSDLLDLAWLFLLSFLITIRCSGDHWPLAAVVAAAMLVYLIKLGRGLPISSI
jgi:hypothetical protein